MWCTVLAAVAIVTVLTYTGGRSLHSWARAFILTCSPAVRWKSIISSSNEMTISLFNQDIYSSFILINKQKSMLTFNVYINFVYYVFFQLTHKFAYHSVWGFLSDTNENLDWCSFVLRVLQRV